jgi:hypothetical protein
MQVESERDLVTCHVEALVEEAEARRIPPDVVGRLLLQHAVAIWLEHRPASDVASELRFTIDHLEGDEDFVFMRP